RVTTSTSWTFPTAPRQRCLKPSATIIGPLPSDPIPRPLSQDTTEDAPRDGRRPDFGPMPLPWSGLLPRPELLLDVPIPCRGVVLLDDLPVLRVALVLLALAEEPHGLLEGL